MSARARSPPYTSGSSRAYLAWDNTNSFFEMYAKSGGGLKFFTNATEQLTIASTGAATFSESVTANATSGGTTMILNGRNNAGVDDNIVSFYKFDGTTLQGRIYARSNILGFRDATNTDVLNIVAGNVGIGTASPDFSLDIEAASGGVQLQIGRTVTSAGSTWMGADSNGFHLGVGTYGAGNSVTDPNGFTVDTSGNLLVGDTLAAAKLWVNKTDEGNAFGARATFATYSSTVGFFGADRNTTDNSFYYIDCYNYGSSSYRFRVADSGNVTNTNNSYGGISDEKLKENIVDATDKLEDLKQVRIRNYNFIGEDKKQIGVIAQELETIFPNMVEETPDLDNDNNDLGTTTKSVKYSVFVPMLVKAMQEQQAIIEDLKTRIEQLEL